MELWGNLLLVLAENSVFCVCEQLFNLFNVNLVWLKSLPMTCMLVYVFCPSLDVRF